MLRKIVSWAAKRGWSYDLCALSALFLFLAFTNFNIALLAYFAFIPFFFTLNNKSRPEAFKCGYFFGLIFFALTIYWLVYVSVLGYIILVLYLALYFGIFAFSIRYSLYATRYLSIILIPLIWVVLEYTRTYLFSGFGWALLGYSQYLNLPFIQIADKTGVWGVSFIIMMVNVTIFKLLKDGLKKTGLVILVTVMILGSTLFYGYFKLEEEPFSKELLVSVIQGNIPQEQKWDERFKEEILKKYDTLTRKAAKEKPHLIIWPETAFPGYLEEEDLRRYITKLARDIGVPLLIGAPTLGDYEKGVYYNSAVLISEEGEILKRYDKLHLVPYGEYVPFEKIFPFTRKLIDKPIGDFSPGEEYTIFELKGKGQFGVLICFEDIFPCLVRNFVKRNASFMVNITNDAWFGKSNAPYQHAQASVFRAVENRVPVIRAANTGLSCFIDSKGRIIDKVSSGEKDIFVEGFKTSKIRIAIK